MHLASGEPNKVQDARATSSRVRGTRRVRFRGASVSIYPKSKGFPYFRVAFRADGRGFRRTFRNHDDALAFAKAKLRELYDGNHVAAALPKSAALAYRFAITKLQEFCADLNGHKVDPAAPDLCLTLEGAISEFIEAKRKLGGVPLSKAVDVYIATAVNIKRISSGKAIEEFLKEREARTRPEKEGARPRLSSRMYYQDSLRLKRFRDAFQMDVCDLRPAHLDLFFAEHLKVVAARTRNHFRSSLSVFIKWAVRKSYLPENHGLSKSDGLRPDGKGKERADVGEVQVYSADELASLLSNAEGPLQALIAVGAFAGLRSEELLRLEWSDLWRCPGFVEVTGRKAKTRARRLIPVCPALQAWLEPFREFTKGRVWPNKAVSFHEWMRDLHDKVKVPRRPNALRHSFASHRLNVIRDEHRVAAECGTSVAMLHGHYREIVRESESRAWFNVMPVGAATNIVSVSLKEKASAAI